MPNVNVTSYTCFRSVTRINGASTPKATSVNSSVHINNEVADIVCPTKDDTTAASTTTRTITSQI